jgi:hypothetical protein
MGVELGEPLQPPSFDNRRGFWENRFFQAVNIELLKRAGCNPNGFDSNQKLKQACHGLKGKAFIKPDINLIGRYTKNSFQDVHWGWKDPRTVITWPYWQHCLTRLGYDDIRPIVLVRHPDLCIASLKQRGDFAWLALPDGQTLEEYIAELWKTYYEIIESHVSSEAVILLHDDLLVPERAAHEMERCAEYLGL